jgi:integral membrane protein
MQDINRSYLRWLIIAGIIEGLSTLVLFFVAMPLKYSFDMPAAVSIAGPVHGFLFLGLVLMFWIGFYKVPLPRRLVVWGMVGAVFPFVPFIVDVPLYKMLQSKQPV